jgi:hypothetical protein
MRLPDAPEQDEPDGDRKAVDDPTAGDLEDVPF